MFLRRTLFKKCVWDSNGRVWTRLGFGKKDYILEECILNNADGNKIPVKDHSTLVSFLSSFLHSQNINSVNLWVQNWSRRAMDVNLNC